MTYSDDDESSNSSTSSMGADPRTSVRYYEHLFKNILKTVFPGIKPKIPGFDHKIFALNFDKLVEKPDWDGFPSVLEFDSGNKNHKDKLMVLSTHIICNQYVRAAKIKDAPWESMEAVCKYYDNGLLPRYVGKALSSSSSSSSTIPDSPTPQDVKKSRDEEFPAKKSTASMMDDLSDESSEEEEYQPESGVTVFQVMKECRVEALEDLARKAEAVAFRAWKGSHGKSPPESAKSIKTYKTYLYPDTDETRGFITDAIKSSLLKISQKMAKRGRTSISKEEDDDTQVKRHKPSPQKVAIDIPADIPIKRTSSSGDVQGYLNNLFGGNNNSGNDPDQVFWGDILKDMGLESAYLPSDDPDQMMKQTKMACGAMFATDKKYKDRCPQKDSISGFRKYLNKHRPDMEEIAGTMMNALLQRKASGR